MTGATGPVWDSAGRGTDHPGPGSGGPGSGSGGPGPGSGSPGPGSGSHGPGDGDAGTDPDARFTFANERTFLAWSRTALALVVAGLGIVQLLPPFPGVPWGRHLIGVPLIVLGAIVAVAGYGEWILNQRALRRGAPIPRSVLPVILTVTIAAMALLSAIVLLLSAIR